MLEGVGTGLLAAGILGSAPPCSRRQAPRELPCNTRTVAPGHTTVHQKSMSWCPAVLTVANGTRPERRRSVMFLQITFPATGDSLSQRDAPETP